jgi:hypothetical protein
MYIREPGHEDIDGNSMADQLPKQGSECPFILHEPACGISMGVVKKRPGIGQSDTTGNTGNPQVD